MRFFILFFILSSQAFAYHIVIDPGHGGTDLGAVRDSFVESKIVYQIAEKLQSNLAKEKNITSRLTRTQNEGVSLKNRVQLAHDMKADLFISLHANSSNSRSAVGMEFYFNSPKAARLSSLTENRPRNPGPETVVARIKEDFFFYDKTEKSLLLSRTLQKKTEEQEQKGIIKRAPFFVIDHTEMPSILVELGFITNRREARKLTSDDYQNTIARLLTSAILEYKEKSDKNLPL